MLNSLRLQVIRVCVHHLTQGLQNLDVGKSSGGTYHSSQEGENLALQDGPWFAQKSEEGTVCSIVCG